MRLSTLEFSSRTRLVADRVHSGNTTINAKFAIDPEHNGGRDFQYDEVVRGREERRHMEADDCECCRDVIFFLFLPLLPCSDFYMYSTI